MKRNGKEFRIITVYGSPYEEVREAFPSELHKLFLEISLPTLIGGDFKLVDCAREKSNGDMNHKWSEKFSSWIEI